QPVGRRPAVRFLPGESDGSRPRAHRDARPPATGPEPVVRLPGDPRDGPRAAASPRAGRSAQEQSTVSYATSTAVVRPPADAVTRALPASSVADRDENDWRSEEHTSELQSRENLVCRLLLEKKKTSDE